MSDNKKNFEMSEPAPHQTRTRFAFWLTTDIDRLFEYVASLLCVEEVRRQEDTGKALISIKDRFDADEAWHYIRSELETESQYVELDSIWEDAMWL